MKRKKQKTDYIFIEYLLRSSAARTSVELYAKLQGGGPFKTPEWGVFFFLVIILKQIINFSFILDLRHRFLIIF